MNKFTKMMAGVVAIGAVAIPAVLVVPALASETPTATTATTAPTTMPATNPNTASPATPRAGAGRRWGLKLLRQAALNKVSAQLGISPDTLRAAVKDARTNHRPAQPIADQNARRQYWLGQIASELHISPQQLQAAVKAARQEIRTELLGS